MLGYPNGCPSISGLMDGYGLLPFDREIEVMVNEALFAPGAYYALGRWGILVLIPARERIVYVFDELPAASCAGVRNAQQPAVP
jgi:hypothetical protein